MMQRSLIILLLSSLSGCALTPAPRKSIHETTYDCSVSEARGTLSLRADLDGVGWIERIDGVSTQAHLNFTDEEDGTKFLRDGFVGRRYDHPILFFDYPPDLKPDENAGYAIKGQPLERFFGGARGGGRVVQMPAASNVFLSLNWEQVQALQSDGGMFVFLYDRSGAVLKTLYLTRDRYAEIERSLKAMFAQARSNHADKDRLCKASTHEAGRDVIVVD